MEPCFHKNERQLSIRREAELVVAAVYKVFSLESTDYMTWLGKLTDVCCCSAVGVASCQCHAKQHTHKKLNCYYCYYFILHKMKMSLLLSMSIGEVNCFKTFLRPI